MADPVELRATVSAATDVLRRRFGAHVSLAEPTVLKDWERNLVVRCLVEPAAGSSAYGHDPVHDSVIIKWIRHDGALGFSEWASLRFLTELPPATGLAPRFLGGDTNARVFVMEDLGGSRSADDVLRVGDAAAATDVMRALAARSGELHAATLGREVEFDTLRARLPDSPGHDRRAEAEGWLGSLGSLDGWMDALGLTRPPGLDAAIRAVAAAYADPGDFLAFTHGDPAPTNNHVTGSHVRLLDFEYGAYRHAIYDMTAWRVLCPLPVPVVETMERAHQAVLSGVCAAARDEERYRDAAAQMTAYRAIVMASRIGPDVLARNEPWVEAWTRREALLAAISRLAATVGGIAGLAPIGRLARAMEDRLRDRWPEYGDPIPQWPAFANPL
ncbi:MAG: hypothetical protein WKG32_16160 [Gemmatimonadaceae bacterium]